MYSIVALYVKERYAGIEISWMHVGCYRRTYLSIYAAAFPQLQREWKRRQQGRLFTSLF
jgi:hypothetical protein